MAWRLRVTAFALVLVGALPSRARQSLLPGRRGGDKRETVASLRSAAKARSISATSSMGNVSGGANGAGTCLLTACHICLARPPQLIVMSAACHPAIRSGP